MKARFERTCFKTKTDKHPFHTVVEEGDIISRSKKAFTVAFEDWVRDGKQFLEAWYADPGKRSYKYIEYGCVKKEDQESSVFYAFPEMRYERLVSISSDEEKRANIEYFLDYIKLLVEDREEYVQWMVMWLADILVNPHDKGKQPVAVILWGKTFLRELMAHFLGDKLVHHTEDPLKNGDTTSTPLSSTSSSSSSRRSTSKRTAKSRIESRRSSRTTRTVSRRKVTTRWT
jgi:hypothetical protein